MTRTGTGGWSAAVSPIEWVTLAYIALPTVIFLGGWLAQPLGGIAAAVVAFCIATSASASTEIRLKFKVGGWLLFAVALGWTLLGGIGHLVFANADWVVRDAVLVDLVRASWPVAYDINGQTTLMRAPIGYFLPAAVVGKVGGIVAAETALVLWTAAGVALTFALLLRDRPGLGAAAVRIGVFVIFSGLDILGWITSFERVQLGTHLEWWAAMFQYSSHTTQLFWVPNHAIPGWLAAAWLVSSGPSRSFRMMVLLASFAPLWSPLTALGIAPLFAVAVVHAAKTQGSSAWRALLDARALVPAAICVALVYPYILLGSEQVASGLTADTPWAGELFWPRYVEFVLVEFLVIAATLLWRRPKDPLLWAAGLVLLTLPLYRFGPHNDLAMRASIPALAVLAISLAGWLSTPRSTDERAPVLRWLAFGILAIGAVTPLMEFVRPAREPRWALNPKVALPQATRGSHYFATPNSPWARRILDTPRPFAVVNDAPPAPR